MTEFKVLLPQVDGLLLQSYLCKQRIQEPVQYPNHKNGEGKDKITPTVTELDKGHRISVRYAL